MGRIERYEDRMGRARDGVWVVFVLSAVVGGIGWAEALVFGGLAWFGLAILRKLPRFAVSLRPHFSRRWRLLNRLLLVYAVVYTGLVEFVRAASMTSFEGFLLGIATTFVLIGISSHFWLGAPKRG